MTDRYPLLKFLVFTAVAIGFSIWLIAIIGNLSLERRAGYAGEFDDVNGLVVNDDVKIAGVSVGKVTGIRVERGTAVVEFKLREDIRLGADSTLEVRWRTVLGQRFLYVHPAGGAPIEPGHVFPTGQTVGPADLNVLLARLTPVMRALDPDKSNLVVQALSEALVGRVDEVRDLIRDGASLTQTLADHDQEIGRLLENSVVVLDAYAAREQHLRRLLDSFAEVAETVAARNDMLEVAVVTIADSQEELGRLLATNDPELRAALDALDGITAILSVNHDRVERLAKFSARGVVAYHRFSRWGQWFNIRAPGTSVGEVTVTTERGAALPDNRPDGATTAGIGQLFGLSGEVR